MTVHQFDYAPIPGGPDELAGRLVAVHTACAAGALRLAVALAALPAGATGSHLIALAGLRDAGRVLNRVAELPALARRAAPGAADLAFCADALAVLATRWTASGRRFDARGRPRTGAPTVRVRLALAGEIAALSARLAVILSRRPPAPRPRSWPPAGALVPRMSWAARVVALAAGHGLPPAVVAAVAVAELVIRAATRRPPAGGPLSTRSGRVSCRIRRVIGSSWAAMSRARGRASGGR